MIVVTPAAAALARARTDAASMWTVELTILHLCLREEREIGHESDWKVLVYRC